MFRHLVLKSVLLVFFNLFEITFVHSDIFASSEGAWRKQKSRVQAENMFVFFLSVVLFWSIWTCLPHSTVANSPCFEAVELEAPLVERDKPLNREQLFDSSTFPWNRNARMTLKKKKRDHFFLKKKQAAVLSSSGCVLEVNQWHCFDVASHIKWLDGFEVGGLCFSILQWITC